MLKALSQSRERSESPKRNYFAGDCRQVYGHHFRLTLKLLLEIWDDMI